MIKKWGLVKPYVLKEYITPMSFGKISNYQSLNSQADHKNIRSCHLLMRSCCPECLLTISQSDLFPEISLFRSHIQLAISDVMSLLLLQWHLWFSIRLTGSLILNQLFILFLCFQISFFKQLFIYLTNMQNH